MVLALGESCANVHDYKRYVFDYIQRNRFERRGTGERSLTKKICQIILHSNKASIEKHVNRSDIGSDKNAQVFLFTHISWAVNAEMIA